MFLLERLFGVGLYSIVLIMICIMLKSYSNKKLFIRLYWVILVVMAYFYVPHTGADLTRNYITMRSYSRLDFNSLIARLGTSTTPGGILYYYLISKLGNEHFLPMFSAAITLAGIFYMFSASKERFGISNKVIAIILFCFMSRGLYLQTISNIRTIMALSMASICIYREFVLKKRFLSTIPLYIIASTIHVMGLVMLIYRLLYMFAINGKTARQVITRFITGTALLAVGYVVGYRFIRGLLNKTTNYYYAAVTGEGYSYIWEGILSAIAIGIVIYMIYAWKKYRRIYNPQPNDTTIILEQLITFMTPLIVMNIASLVVEFNYYERLSWMLSILSIPLGIFVLFNIKNKSAYNKTRHVILGLSIIQLALACARGDLCSLKFFLL